MTTKLNDDIIGALTKWHRVIGRHKNLGYEFEKRAMQDSIDNAEDALLAAINNHIDMKISRALDDRLGER